MQAKHFRSPAQSVTDTSLVEIEISKTPWACTWGNGPAYRNEHKGKKEREDALDVLFVEDTALLRLGHKKLAADVSSSASHH